MEQLTTATGKMFSCDYFNPSAQTNRCNLRVVGANLADVATVFSNPSETVQLWCGGMYASQYTKLIAIAPEGDAIRVILGKE